MNKRQLAAQETRRKIIAAAKEIINEKGLANTSIAEITQKSGVANGTFYTYFKRKEDIVYALSHDTYQQVLDDALAYAGDFEARMTFFLVGYARSIEGSGLKLCQEWVRNTVDPNLVENEADRNKLAFDIHSTAELIQDGVERGELEPSTPVKILAHTLMDVIYGQMLCWDMSDGAYSFTDRTQEFCALFLHPMLAPYMLSPKH
ncbi:TetR/AcrR family transcriptional regulator [Alloscardovia criceti]|uniref:TetR/AcrR family transcriptional regulator n=1 Tax=Alloscardovia criceti TaxID=356828 RepID=UPI00037A2BC3|nr:TetR/AcrR family transcriptional regulator [Alloscardovia criceti]